MCAVAAIPYVIMGIGALSSANSKQQQGYAASAAYQFNQSVAHIQAQDALARGAEDELRLRREGGLLIGTQRSGFSGQGVDINSGSALEVQMDTARQVEFDALTIRNNASKEAWGYEVGAVNFGMQSKAAEAQGSAGATGDILGGIGGML